MAGCLGIDRAYFSKKDLSLCSHLKIVFTDLKISENLENILVTFH